MYWARSLQVPAALWQSQWQPRWWFRRQSREWYGWRVSPRLIKCFGCWSLGEPPSYTYFASAAWHSSRVGSGGDRCSPDAHRRCQSKLKPKMDGWTCWFSCTFRFGTRRWNKRAKKLANSRISVYILDIGNGGNAKILYAMIAAFDSCDVKIENHLFLE